MARLLQDIDLNEIIENLRYLIDNDQMNFALPVIADLHPADIAEIMAHLDGDERRALFHIIPSEKASLVFEVARGGASQ